MVAALSAQTLTCTRNAILRRAPVQIIKTKLQPFVVLRVIRPHAAVLFRSMTSVLQVPPPYSYAELVLVVHSTDK